MIVNAENITKSFGQLQVLKGVDFKADEAEVVAIMGASGWAQGIWLLSVTAA